MNTGWVKLHRKILDSRVFANEGLLRLWIYCLCRANHKNTYVQITTGRGTTEVEVQAGQFIFGRHSVSNDLNMNPSTLYKRMQKLQEIDNINIESNTHYSLVSICNWGTYQDSENKKEQPKEQASNNEVTGKVQASNTDKNVNNDKNEKKKQYTPDLEDVIQYFTDNGYTKDSAKKFYNYYEASIEGTQKKYWRDSKGNKVKSWKQKAQSVWFKPKNKITTNGLTDQNGQLNYKPKIVDYD